MNLRIGHTTSGPRPYWLGLLLAFGLLAAAPPAAAAGNEIKPNGRWKRFEVETSGGHDAWLFEAEAGVRYRVTVEGRTLERPIAELYVGRSEAAVDTVRPGAAGEPATLDWQARADEIVEIRLTGFSLSTGTGRVKLEPLDWAGNPTKKAQRWLGVGDDDTFAVSDLVLGQSDRWLLVLEPGKRYEVSSSQGRVARVRMRVSNQAAVEIADSNAWWAPYEATGKLRFVVPEATAPALLPYRLDVEAVWPSAGDYGVRLRELAAEEVAEPPEGVIQPDAEAALVEETPLTFTLGEGDMAVLWIPEGHPMPQRAVYMQLRSTWIPAEASRPEQRDLGQIARGRRPGAGNFQSFRPYQPGTYRFSSLPGRAAVKETLRLFTKETLGPPPVHMGTASDPTSKARLRSRWQPIGLGICVPGITYLFVTTGAHTSVDMRVRTLDGKSVATRRGTPVAPGFGPSMRFEVPEPMVVRLEAKGGRRTVAALLRELRSGG